MSPKSFIQFHQEGRKILGVQVRCLQTGNRQETHRPGFRGGPTRGGPPKKIKYQKEKKYIMQILK